MLTSKTLDFFLPDPAQPRKAFAEGELRLLGESLKKKQLVPVIARPDGVLIDGERRWRAAKLSGLATLDVIITDEALSPPQVLELQLVSSLHRADLLPYELYAGCQQWLSSHPGATARELGARIDRDAGHLSKVLSLSRCVGAVQEAAAAGRLSISDWYAISKVAEAEQSQLLDQKLRGATATRDALETAARKKRGGNRPAVGAKKIQIRLACGVTVAISGEHLTLDAAIEAAAEALKEMKRGRDQGLTAKTIQKVSADRAKAGA